MWIRCTTRWPHPCWLDTSSTNKTTKKLKWLKKTLSNSENYQWYFASFQYSQYTLEHGILRKNNGFWKRLQLWRWKQRWCCMLQFILFERNLSYEDQFTKSVWLRCSSKYCFDILLAFFSKNGFHWSIKNLYRCVYVVWINSWQFFTEFG